MRRSIPHLRTLYCRYRATLSLLAECQARKLEETVEMDSMFNPYVTEVLPCTAEALYIEGVKLLLCL